MFGNLWRKRYALFPGFIYKKPATGFTSLEEQDIECTFLNPSEFGKTVIYQPSNGSSKSVVVLITSQREQTHNSGVNLDGEYSSGLGKVSYIYAYARDVAYPVYRDKFLDGGIKWKVLQATRMGQLWKISAKSDEKAEIV